MTKFYHILLGEKHLFLFFMLTKSPEITYFFVTPSFQASVGWVAEWLMATDCKSVDVSLR